MSTPFEFSFQGSDGHFDLSRMRQFGHEFEAWANENYGTETCVTGLIAYSEDMRIVGVYVQAFGVWGGEPDTSNLKQWPEVVEWLTSLGSVHVMTFSRRGTSHDAETGMPVEWDAELADTTDALAVRSKEAYGTELTYQGHLVVDHRDADGTGHFDVTLVQGGGPGIYHEDGVNPVHPHVRPGTAMPPQLQALIDLLAGQAGADEDGDEAAAPPSNDNLGYDVPDIFYN